MKLIYYSVDESAVVTDAERSVAKKTSPFWMHSEHLKDNSYMAKCKQHNQELAFHSTTMNITIHLKWVNSHYAMMLPKVMQEGQILIRSFALLSNNICATACLIIPIL